MQTAIFILSETIVPGDAGEMVLFLSRSFSGLLSQWMNTVHYNQNEAD